jgi:hypothetical protein
VIPVKKPSPASLLRIALALACFLVATGFDACDDDPLLDSSGGTGCAGSHCGARILPDSSVNPVTF